MSFNFGGSSSKNKTTDTLDPKLSSALYSNLDRANSLADTTTYHTLDPSQIQAQMDPYTQDVVDTTTADYQKTAAIDQQHVNDAARAAGAFGGSRHGVQAGVTAANGQNNLAQIIAQLRSQGFTQAQQTAQTENTNQNNLPLALQALLNSTISTIPKTGSTTSKGSAAYAGGSFAYGGKQ